MTAERLTPPDAEALPIDPILPRIVESLKGNPCLVLQAPPGAGKTTRVPPALLAAGVLSGRILMLEPRRVATRAAARRIAKEWGWTLGEEVGYRMRFERCEGPRTRILVMTEGTLLGWLQADPFLDGVSAVLFDEIHERSLDADLGLALCRRIQEDARPDLVLLAMSATLDSGPIARALGDCPVVTSEGRRYDVTLEYSVDQDRRSLIGRTVNGVRRVLDRAGGTASGPGHVLVFLPGVGEINRVHADLLPLARERGLDLLPLYGSLPPQEQDAALQPSPRRKIVLATNVAETSITIPGIRAVVDSGLARVMRFDPGRGLDRLELIPIARDSADQRAGRAGRESPGYCLRLWSERDQANRLPHLPPEIQRVDLSGALLQLLAWGESDLAHFPWIDPPSPYALEAATRLLRDLNALDEGGLTTQGRQMARLPVAPRLGRLLLASANAGISTTGARVAALLSERSPFRHPGRDAPAAAPGDSDLTPRLQALDSWATKRRTTTTPYGPLVPAAADRILRVAAQLERSLPRGLSATRAAEPEALDRALLAAFPDRVARRRPSDPDRAIMVGGSGVLLGRETAVRTHDLFLALEVQAGRRGALSEGSVHLAVAIDPKWLPGIVEIEEAEIDGGGRVRVVRRRRYQDLVIDETAIPTRDRAVVEAALVEAAGQKLQRHLPLNDPSVAQFLARLRSLAHWRPELDLPTFGDEDLLALLPSLVLGARSLSDLERAPLLEVLRGSLHSAHYRLLNEQAPSHVELPRGRTKRLQYEAGRPPVLAARIQELFGMEQTPTVAGGRVKVLLHLLAPNFRPQQVTDDLAGFWRNTYPEVRKELRGRYPKHDWPEDPFQN